MEGSMCKEFCFGGKDNGQHICMWKRSCMGSNIVVVGALKLGREKVSNFKLFFCFSTAGTSVGLIYWRVQRIM